MLYHLLFIALLSLAIYFTRRGVSENAYSSAIFFPVDYAELLRSIVFSVLVSVVIGIDKDSNSSSPLVISFIFSAIISISLSPLPIEERIGNNKFMQNILMSVQNIVMCFLLFWVLSLLFKNLVSTSIMIIFLSFVYRCKASQNILDYFYGLERNEYVTNIELYVARKQCKQALHRNQVKNVIFYHAASFCLYSIVAFIFMQKGVSYTYPSFSLENITGLFLGDFSALALNFVFKAYFDWTN